MALQFHPLPLDVFPDEARPPIARLNAELRDLFALEGVLRNPIAARRSDLSIARRSDVQVDVSRITPTVSTGGGTASVTVGVPSLTLGTANTVGTTTTVISINSGLALFGLSLPRDLGTAAVGTSSFAARADHVHSLSGLVSAIGATPAILYGTTYVDGVASTFVRTDATLKYPSALMSTANAATLMFTDNAVDSTLSTSLGNFILISGGNGGLIFDVDTSGAGLPVALVRIRPSSGNFVGLQTSLFTGAVGSTTTLRSWDAVMSSFAGTLSTATIIGYDSSTFSISPPVGSTGTNTIYGARLQIAMNNANAVWGDAVTAYFRGVRRSISSPLIDVQATVIIEPPTAGLSTSIVAIGSSQIGLYFRQQAAQATAASRIAIQIDAQNSGTNRWSIRAANKIENTVADFICGTSQKGIINKDGQATPRFWRTYTDAVEGCTGGVTYAVDATGVLTVTRVTGCTGTLNLQIGDVGTVAPLL